MNDILENQTGQTGERIRKDTDRDFIMTAQQSLEYGIIDRVIDERQ